MDVGGCLCPISSRVWRDGMASLKLMNSAPSSASNADGMTALMILAIVKNFPLLGGNAMLLEINQCPPALLQALVLERYEASMWPARIISLAWYVMTESGCETA